MSRQDASRFIDDTSKDQELLEKIKALGIGDGEVTVAFFARVAKEFGYDFTAEELEAESKARQEAGIEVVDGAELNDEELDRIAGGQCLYNDECEFVFHYYKSDPECSSTFNHLDHCAAVDKCSVIINYYNRH